MNTPITPIITDSPIFKDMSSQMLKNKTTFFDFRADIIRCLGGQNLTRRETVQNFLKFLDYYNVTALEFYKLINNN